MREVPGSNPIGDVIFFGDNICSSVTNTMQQLQQQNIENPVIQVWRYQRVDQKVVFGSRIYDTMAKSKEDKKTINDPQNIT